MIDGKNMAQRDIGSPSDPFLIIKLGKHEFNEEKIYQLDEPNPKFFKNYDFEAYFPGCPLLTINVMDYDSLFGNDLIGTTIIDLEDRYFTNQWMSIKDKPIEYRPLYHPCASIA